jgi:hypothetical protein
MCKHIYFLIGRVACLQDLAGEISSDKSLFKQKFTEISDVLLNKLRSRLNEDNTTSNTKGKEKVEEDKIIVDKDDMCSICFEVFGDEEILSCKTQCKNSFHYSCINEWLNVNTKKTCPLCRTEWCGDDDDKEDETNGEDCMSACKINLVTKPIIRIKMK